MDRIVAAAPLDVRGAGARVLAHLQVLAAENDLKVLMADVTRAMEKAQEAVARIAYKATAAEAEVAAPVREAERKGCEQEQQMKSVELAEQERKKGPYITYITRPETRGFTARMVN